MDMRQYLLDTFAFNDGANRALIRKVQLLPDPSEAIRHLSHLIHCQYKWMARIRQDPNSPQLEWWGPSFPLDRLEPEWENSLQPWLDYIRDQSPEGLATPVQYPGYDLNRWEATPQDIALQLNYHSIHHRAQIQAMLRAQGVEPDFVDYIGTKARRIG
jgi:uncharacterized damage-inducible protein DinB